MAEALDRYLERPDADERVQLAHYCVACGDCPCCNLAAIPGCTKADAVALAGLSALAAELEEARGILRLALKELGPLGLIGADGRRHYSTENWRQLLRARYREEAKP